VKSAELPQLRQLRTLEIAMTNSHKQRTTYIQQQHGCVKSVLVATAFLALSAHSVHAQTPSSTAAPVDPSINRIMPTAVEPPTTCPPTDGTRPDPTLVNTDNFVLSRFSLARVYEQLASLSGVGAPNATELYQQMWDSVDVAANAKFDAPHCDDPGAINGFPISCPRPEAVTKDSPLETFTPVALFNRFDLAAADGSHCGEYRIIYALNATGSTPPPTPIAGRNFIIFEGVLPNPTPQCGIESCRPVVKFWQSLAKLDANTQTGQQALADGLETFYFKGLSGFEPVVHPAHYGQTGGGGYGQRSGGQIRVNMFVNFQQWQLREFHLLRQCDGTNCKLLLDPVTVKTNPFHQLFNTLQSNPDVRAGRFQSTFPVQAQPLANDSLAHISMGIDDTFNAGQSTSQAGSERYDTQLQLGNPPNAFSLAIQRQLTTIGRSDLTPIDLAKRATTQSCAGCHELSNGVALGGKLNPTWPASRRFVHVDESGFLSPALWCVFLPARKTVLNGFSSSTLSKCIPTGPVVPPVPVVVVDSSVSVPTARPASLTVSGKIAGPN
jgi:hypothetical protein